MGDFKILIVWQKSVSLVTKIYHLTEKYPKHEIFGLTSQIRRASVSIPSNIAEGHSRRSSNDYIQFLKIVQGSLAELETQILISKNLNFISENQYVEFETKSIEIAKNVKFTYHINPKN